MIKLLKASKCGVKMSEELHDFLSSDQPQIPRTTIIDSLRSGGPVKF